MQELKEKNAFDVITSNGLNMYESDPDRLVALYRRFFEALKPGNLVAQFPHATAGKERAHR